MEKRREEDDSGPRGGGVCHRLFSWVLSRLVGFIRWRLSSSAGATAAASTEVPIEYTVNGSGDHRSTSRDFPKKDDHDKPISTTSVDHHHDHVLGQVIQDNTATAAAAGGGGRAKVMTIDNNKQGEEKRRWPRLSLVTNINEISDDYIRKRKAAMQRTNTNLQINS